MKTNRNWIIVCGLTVLIVSGVANAQIRPTVRPTLQRTANTWKLLSTDSGVYRYDSKTGKTEFYRRTMNGPTECEWMATLDLKSVPEAGDAGRYEVLEAKGGGSARVGLLVRFDHQTGRTWSYSSAGGLYEWMETQKK
jgi:hypothetical protein